LAPILRAKRPRRHGQRSVPLPQPEAFWAPCAIRR
jgi:hypothetical protein